MRQTVFATIAIAMLGLLACNGSASSNKLPNGSTMESEAATLVAGANATARSQAATIVPAVKATAWVNTLDSLGIAVQAERDLRARQKALGQDIPAPERIVASPICDPHNTQLEAGQQELVNKVCDLLRDNDPFDPEAYILAIKALSDATRPEGKPTDTYQVQAAWIRSLDALRTLVENELSSRTRLAATGQDMPLSLLTIYSAPCTGESVLDDSDKQKVIDRVCSILRDSKGFDPKSYNLAIVILDKALAEAQ